MSSPDPKRVRVLINPRSGLGISMRVLIDAFEENWTPHGNSLSYQMSHTEADGNRKVDRAVADGIGTLIVVGGDGMINTVARRLLNTGVQFGVIPTGSGNGFARHFSIPLNPTKAIQSLAEARPHVIDVGTANGRPFFVTCSLAWDAALVKTFEKSPVRGVLPYVFAAAYELFEYKPERFKVQLDDNEPMQVNFPMLFTIANLTQYGGGAVIAPQAKADDGHLWLTYACKDQVTRLIPQLPQLFNGKLHKVSGVELKRFRKATVTRETDHPIQVDGELVDAPATVEIGIQPLALNVLVPKDFN